MRNFDLAECFHEIADLLEIREDNVFRVRAYRRAADQLESLAQDVVEALQAKKKIPGIGADLAAKIREWADTGSMGYLEELRRGLPRGVRQLMSLPGVGPKTAKLLHERLGIDSVEGLDLKDSHARRARDLGLALAIDTDTHYLSELDHIELGIATARRAWIGPEQVVNARPLDRLLDWARAGRPPAGQPLP